VLCLPSSLRLGVEIARAAHGSPSGARPRTSHAPPAQFAVAGAELHMPTSLLYSPKRQGDVALKPHVASVYFKCFKCFRGMLQVFYIDVAKVDRDVANVAMVFQVYAPNVSSVSDVCCNCFIWMLHIHAYCKRMF